MVERLDRITTSQAAPLVERYGNPTRTDVVIESLLVGAAYLESQASVTAETRPTDKPAAVGLDENEDWLTGDLL